MADNLVGYSNTPVLPFVFSFNSRFYALKGRSILQLSNRKWCWESRKRNFCSISASCALNSSTFGGWDDLKLVEDSSKSGKLDQLQNFLISVGINDRKHLVVFLLGLVSALAISRARVSSVIVFPASVLLFAVGFSLGFVRGNNTTASSNLMSVNGSKKTSREENSGITAKKLTELVDFFRGLDLKITKLMDEMKEAIDSNQIQAGQLEYFLDVVKSISLSMSPARDVVEVSFNSIGRLGNFDDSLSVLVDDQAVEGTLNQKPSRRRKDLGAAGFDFSLLLKGLFQENPIGTKPKSRDNVKREPMESWNSKEVSHQTQGTISAPAVEEVKILNMTSSDDIANVNAGSSRQGASNKAALDQGDEKLVDNSRTKETISGKRTDNSINMDGSVKRLLKSDETSYHDVGLQFAKSNGTFLKVGDDSENETQASHDHLIETLHLNNSPKPSRNGPNSLATDAETYLGQKEILNKSNGARMPSYSQQKIENRTDRFFREERLKSKDKAQIANQQSAHDMAMGSISSSMVSDDVAFDRNLTDATDLLKQARLCLRSKGDEERADTILYKSARLLAKAVDMKPMSLLAVGQLGNTLLLHGELKLKISRELRALLPRSDSVSVERWSWVLLKGPDDQILNRDKIISVLVDVCEECEQLLVEAGRKYRMALSIDGNDIRALYNWGLALFFRAQLIAEIGPEAAFDADKLYMASIDKFDAMVSKSNAYAPNALFRWALVLQHRSRLWPNGSKEKVKLLRQAKSLFEDALRMDSTNFQVREALSSCISELGFSNL